MQLVAEVDGDDDREIIYVPHHTLLKHDSRTTKLRVVFDASLKSTNWELLNYTLLIGTIVQQDLLSIVLKFRTYQIAFTADTDKVYQSMLIPRAVTNTVESFIRCADSE